MSYSVALICSTSHAAGAGLWVAALLLLGLAATVRRAPARGRQQDLGVLQRIASMVNRSLDLTTILGKVLEELTDLLRMEAAFIRLLPGHDGGTRALVHRGFGTETLSVLDAGEQWSAGPEGREENPPLVIQNLAEDPNTDLLRDALRNERFKSFALYPVRFGNRMVGSIGLGSRRAKAQAEWQEALISAAAEILGVAIVNTRLQEQAAKLSEDLIALQEVNKIISRGFDLEDIIRRIVVEGKRLVKTSQCHLFLLDDRQQRLVGSASTQEENLDIRHVMIPLSEPSTAITALTEKRTIAVDGVPPVEGPLQALMESMGWSAAIFAPLITKEQAIGVLICSDDSRDRRFSQEEISRAETLAHQAAIALENARLFQVVSRSQKEWETTFDAMQDCVSVHDTSGKVIRANLALARRLKTIPQKVIGKYCSELYCTASTDGPCCGHTGSLQSEGLIVEEVELPEMGGTFQLSVGPWYDKNNRLAGSIHVAKDISNEKLLQQQLIQSEKLSAIGELISGIAHELNNPLTGVMGYSQLLQMRGDLDERAKDSLVKINNLATRCQKIVQNLLSFARKQKPERTLASINEILERTVELRSYELQVNNIELLLELDPRLPRTIADAHQLQQVFLNVITNAEQAMLEASGRGKLTIRTRSDAAGGRVVIEIADDGPGIPEQHLTRIFDPFFTTKEVGKGTGLGLSLAYGIIKEHAGNIYARSRLGEGSTFVIELPVIGNLHEATGLAEELVPQGLHFEDLVRGKRILVVDDEKYILDFFVEVLQMYPVDVDTACDGRAAMDMMQLHQYDLIITDFKMPHMSGRDLFEWIKEHRPHLASRIVFVTGDTVSPETRSFFESTANRYLAKPFRIEEVREVVQQTLEAARL
jgi:two-component system NtrC family sensor kinase